MSGLNEVRGIISALLNSFDDSGAPDIAALKKIIDYNIKVCGVDGLYVNGSTGENFNLPHEYKKTFLRAAAEANDSRVNLIAQIGCNVIEEVFELAKLAADYGYRAISAVTPFYYVYTTEAVIDYYFNLAERSELPLIVYNIPIRTGVALSREQFKTLLSHENIAGVKFTHNDFYQLETIRTDFPSKLIYSGFDEMLLSAAVLGTDGAIGTTYNIIGHWAKKVFEGVSDNNLTQAREYQHKLNNFIRMALETDLLPTMKALYRYFGIECGSCRLPIPPVSKAQIERAGEIYNYIKAQDAK